MVFVASFNCCERRQAHSAQHGEVLSRGKLGHRGHRGIALQLAEVMMFSTARLVPDSRGNPGHDWVQLPIVRLAFHGGTRTTAGLQRTPSRSCGPRTIRRQPRQSPIVSRVPSRRFERSGDAGHPKNPSENSVDAAVAWHVSPVSRVWGGGPGENESWIPAWIHRLGRAAEKPARLAAWAMARAKASSAPGSSSRRRASRPIGVGGGSSSEHCQRW